MVVCFRIAGIDQYGQAEKYLRQVVGSHLKNYVAKLTNKQFRLLLPGCGS